MDDQNIIALYWARSETAISETAQKYGGYCFSIAKNILTNHEDAEESVNDTYLTAWNAMPPRRPSILATFLGKITRSRPGKSCRILHFMAHSALLSSAEASSTTAAASASARHSLIAFASA